MPTLNGIDVHALPALWIPFVLINLGCALRVVGQTLTDFSAVFFPYAGISGLLEVGGLAVWGFHLAAIMLGIVHLKSPVHEPPRGIRPGDTIQPDHRVGDVLAVYPELLPVMVAQGFKPLENPILRSILAKRITIESACRKLDLDCAELVRLLNRNKTVSASPSSSCQTVYQIN